VYCPQCGVEYRDGFTGIQFAMVNGLPEAAGIPHIVPGQITTLVHNVDGFLGKWVHLQVPRDREGNARELLEQLLQPVSQEDNHAEG
jgi:hypothetical protein